MSASADPVQSPSQPIVLVADDHDDTRAMLRELLTMNGFVVIECEDGAKTLAEAQRTLPDLVVLDGCLPDLDGLDVARALRESLEGTHVPIVFVSGDDRHTDRALEAGCDSALLKPIDPEELVTIIRQLARRADGYIGPRAGD
jgi:DNA-binding response OmpR family regulator